jgi:hypothetical protein
MKSMKQSYSSKKTHTREKAVSFLICLALIMGIVFIVSCSTRQKGPIPQTMTILPSISNSLAEVTSRATQTSSKITSTPTYIVNTLTNTMNPIYDMGMTVEVTQAPIKITTAQAVGTEYLYENVTVTIGLVDQFDAIAYLNLDNLTDNGTNSSDIEIERTIGNEEFYSMYPINNSYYYFSETNNVDYDSCLDHLPVTGIYEGDYSLQGEYLLKRGGSFCILTNEGRIAIVSYINGSKKNLADWSEELSFKITVFGKIVDNQ